ncbi:hypothetical protein RCL_jg16939.t1 [Rhizophagus clarus]|uniref:Uncharacterized protein n=1 Tax=Rhizophagus clarus TaxID=94130 RepID=A0A8H3QVC4_9GLOM|nr:hypothetical protein RCL_jg21089.t1 [Rhizophagus clarus]GES97371.1 hypothetical protein RCL_jg16939.t1 [Rhizophagus clarus]
MFLLESHGSEALNRLWDAIDSTTTSYPAAYSKYIKRSNFNESELLEKQPFLEIKDSDKISNHHNLTICDE